MIRLARPSLDAREEEAVTAVLRSGMLVQGRRVEAFEALLSQVCDRAYARCVSSGSAALELALRAIGVEGSEVLCPDLSWPSPAHAIVRAGATPVLVDVSSEDWNASAAAFKAAKSERCRAAIVIDQFGMPADYPGIRAALGDLPLLGDSACALGSQLEGKPCMSWADLSCLSFHPRKLVTTGEGGACVTSDERFASLLSCLRNHGQGMRPGSFPMAGGNYRMTEMQAALGVAQMARLDAMLQARRDLAEEYRAQLKGPWSFQQERPAARSNWQTFGLCLSPEGLRSGARDRIVSRLAALGVEAGRLSYALHRLDSLRRYAKGSYPNASRLDEWGLALPMHCQLSFAELRQVRDAFAQAYEEEARGAL